MNHMLCHECFTVGGPTEEKACTHTHGLDAGRTVVCGNCGRTRKDTDPPWHCLGSIGRYSTAVELLRRRDQRRLDEERVIKILRRASLIGPTSTRIDRIVNDITNLISDVREGRE